MLAVKSILIKAAILMAAASSVHAQAAPDSLVARRVRLHLIRQDRTLEGAVPRQVLRGTIARVTADSVSVVIHPAVAPFGIATTGIYQIDVSRGVSATRTAVVRGIQGAAMWALLESLNENRAGRGRDQNILAWAGGGLLFGAAWGAIFPEERWRRVFRR